MRSWRTIIIVAIGVLLVGCGEQEEPVRDASTPITTGSAAVSCSDAAEGEEQQDLQPDPQQALTQWVNTAGRTSGIEAGDLVTSVEQVGRVLFVDEEETGVVAAVVAGKRVEDGDTGWAVLSWARCTD